MSNWPGRRQREEGKEREREGGVLSHHHNDFSQLALQMTFMYCGV